MSGIIDFDLPSFLLDNQSSTTNRSEKSEFTDSEQFSSAIKQNLPEILSEKQSLKSKATRKSRRLSGDSALQTSSRQAENSNIRKDTDEAINISSKSRSYEKVEGHRKRPQRVVTTDDDELPNQKEIRPQKTKKKGKKLVKLKPELRFFSEEEETAHESADDHPEEPNDVEIVVEDDNVKEKVKSSHKKSSKTRENKQNKRKRGSKDSLDTDMSSVKPVRPKTRHKSNDDTTDKHDRKDEYSADTDQDDVMHASSTLQGKSSRGNKNKINKKDDQSSIKRISAKSRHKSGEDATQKPDEYSADTDQEDMSSPPLRGRSSRRNKDKIIVEENDSSAETVRPKTRYKSGGSTTEQQNEVTGNQNEYTSDTDQEDGEFATPSPRESSSKKRKDKVNKEHDKSAKKAHRSKSRHRSSDYTADTDQNDVKPEKRERSSRRNKQARSDNSSCVQDDDQNADLDFNDGAGRRSSRRSRKAPERLAVIEAVVKNEQSDNRLTEGDSQGEEVGVIHLLANLLD